MDGHTNRAEYVILDIFNQSKGLDRNENCCIYKIPQSLRKNCEDALTPPVMVSIGSYHHGGSKLKEMEEYKHFYFNCFYESLTSDVEKRKMKEFAKMLDEGVDIIRGCYSKRLTNFDKTKFVRMMILDSIFIMEIFLRKNDPAPRYDDYLFLNAMVATTIARDLMLAENQIPFFLLINLFDQVVPPMRKHGCLNFLELARKFFKNYDPHSTLRETEIASRKLLSPDWNKPMHFTDLIRSLNVSLYFINDRGPTPSQALKTAKKLKATGVSFKPISNKCLFDVRFEKRFQTCLKIPELVFNWSTGALFHNLMVYEMCHYSKHLFVCSYISLLTSLIHTNEDVEILTKKKVIICEMGSDQDMARAINSLSSNLVTNFTCHGALTRRVNKHCDHWWNKRLALLLTTYFSNIWQGTTTIVTIIGLLFAITGFARKVQAFINGK